MVFISYARKDAAALADRLADDLKRKGFEVSLDSREIAGGVTWTKEIEEALDAADFVLALLTSDSYASEIFATINICSTACCPDLPNAPLHL